MSRMSIRLSVIVCLSIWSSSTWGGPIQTPAEGFAASPVVAADLDAAAFAQWADGSEKPIETRNGPLHVLWTRTSQADWDGVRFGESKQPGLRHLRIGFAKPIALGAVLVRGGGKLSVLKANAAYPGNLADESQWAAAQRLAGRQISGDEVRTDDYAIWVLPRGTSTRAIRFTHSAEITDKSYAGWLGGAYILPQRVANIAPQSVAIASANDEKAEKINNTIAEPWSAWDNGKEGGAQVISDEHAETVLLVWPRPVSLSGLCALWAGFAACEAQTYTGPGEQHPRQASDSDWKSVKQFNGLENQYPRALGPNWLDFGQTITTRAVRLRLTKVTTEGHPHLKNNTRAGKRVWLGELMALQAMGDADLVTAILPVQSQETHPPIPVRFELKEPAIVTLVIEDSAGKRVRNLVAETPFPAGPNVAWWDSMDDLGRDIEAARHGIYNTPGTFVAPGTYRVRGLARKQLDLRYEFSIYNGGHPAWETADATGGWLTNHTPPSAALFVPGERSLNGQPMMYLGSYVAEGGHGLAWFDIDGKKIGGRGWVGGAWTGAPYLARDAGDAPDANTFVYVGAAWEKDLRLTALTKSGDKNVVKYAFDNKDVAVMGGMAIRNGLMAVTLPKLGQVLFVDAKAGKALEPAPMQDGRGLAFDKQGRLLAVVGKQVIRYTMPGMKQPQVLIATGLEDPQQVALDEAGNIYITDRGASHQVKVFSPDGKPLRAIGRAGAPKAGPYDPLHMNNPKGLAIDSNARLWVTEEDYQPKRVSVWTLDGQFVKAYYGPSGYGGGGGLDPADKSRFYYHGMEFKLDWDKGADQLVRVFFRPGPDELGTPDGHACNGTPETAIYVAGRRYFTNCYNSNPTNGTPIAMIWIDRDGLAVPVAALGRANDWKLLKTDPFKSRLPGGADLKGDYWRNQVTFAWSDLNQDGKLQPEEVQFEKGTAGGITVMPDLACVASRAHDSAMRFAVQRFTPQGVPVYELAKGETLVAGARESSATPPG